MRARTIAPFLLLSLVACGGGEVEPRCPDGPAAMPPKAPASVAQAASAPPPAASPPSDEGMWLLNAFPSDRVAERYGFKPDQAFLDHIRLSAVRLAGGCSGSIVSSTGLVMTNHHCVSQCVQELSSKKKDLIQQGFYAKTEADETRCTKMELNQLIDISDVTARVETATQGKEGAAYADARKGEFSRIEKECATSDELRCDVVTLYQGGQYHLYKYKRYQDVRLVFAPEIGTAFFGGDPDNFNFPRYDLDSAFVRIYDGGKPAKMQHHLAWSQEGAKAGDLTFVAGHPARTSRLKTVAELTFERDVRLPAFVAWLSELRGFATQYGMADAEKLRISKELLFGVENGLKALKGRHAALGDEAFFASKVQAEADLRSHIAKDEALANVRGAFESIERAVAAHRRIYTEYTMVEKGYGFYSKLFDMARTLARSADELSKPNEARLREYADARLPQLKQELFSDVPTYADFETKKLGFGLIKLRETLGADHPLVKAVLGKDEPNELAARLIKGSKLADPKVRKALFEGGKAAQDAAKDPLIELARAVDAAARAVRKAYEDEVEGAIEREGARIAKARFAVYGTTTYPDATFSLRLSFGSVQGYKVGDTQIAPFTTIGGAFERATGKPPFNLPQSWLAAEKKLDPKVPLNMVTTNDIIGGNSGSPVINKNGEVVGLIFDGNIHSLGGEYGYDGRQNRAVSVTSAAIVHALQNIYGAERIVKELGK